MIKKNVLSIALLSLVWCSSSYSMDYDEKRQLQTSDGKIVWCNKDLCKLSTTITRVMELSENSSSEIPLKNVNEETWNLLHLILKIIPQGKKDVMQLLPFYQINELVDVIKAADYLDIRTSHDEIILTDIIAAEIARQLLTDERKKEFLISKNSLQGLDPVPDLLLQMISKKIMIASLEKMKCLQRKHYINYTSLENLGFIVDSAEFNTKGDKIVLATNTTQAYKARIWDVKSGKIEQVFQNHPDFVNSASFNFAGDKIVTASCDKKVRIFDVKSGKCERVLEGHTDKVRSALFNRTGDKIVSASDDGTIRIWNIKSGKCESVLKGHTDKVSSASFNTSGDKIVSGSWDKTLRIWDAKSGICEQVLKGHAKRVGSVAFNQIGDKIVSASADETVRIWDVKSGTCVEVLQGHTQYVNSAVFNDRGDKIVSASRDKTVRIWDVETGTCVQVLQGNTSDVYNAKFNYSGNKIVSALEHQRVGMWDISGFLSAEDYLVNKIGVSQALLLVCWNDARSKLEKEKMVDTPHLWTIIKSIKDAKLFGFD